MNEPSEQPVPRRPSPARIARLGGAAVVALVVWAILVTFAIDLGAPPRSATRWTLLVLVSLLAMIALFGSLVAAVRAAGELRSPAPPRYRGRRQRR